MANPRHISMALTLIILSQLLFSCGTAPADVHDAGTTD